NLIETSNDNMLEALKDAIIYTLFVLLIFLANFRALIAAAISIPMVFFGTLAFLYLTGGELNIVIYTAIILALGMLTDDAVVVLENIERHLQEGDENAIYNGTKEVLKPIFAGTISTIAVIFPLMFVGGYPEKIFRPLIETLVVALLISWFLSVTFIPKLASYLYKKGTQKTKVERFFETLYQKTFARLIPFYIGILDFSNKGILRRIILMMGAFLFLVFSLKNIFPTIGRDVMPPMDTGIIKADIEFSSNLNADETKKRLKPFLEWLNSKPWLVKSSIAIGTERGVLSIGSGGGGSSVGMSIITVDRFHRKKTIWEIEDEIRDKLATLKGIKKIAVFDFGATALSTIKAPLDVQFRSEVYDDLPKIAQKAKEVLYNVRGLTSVIKSWDSDFEDVVVDIDSKKAIEFGITPIDILSQIAMKDNLVGIVSFPSMNEPVRIRFKSSYEELKNLLIDTKKGLVPLSYFGDIKKEFTYSRIDRYNLEYAIDVKGYRNKRPISKITDDANKILKENKVTNYYQVGDIKEMNDAFRRLVKAVLIGVVILVLTLMVVYESIRYALIMIVVLPLSMIGAMWALLIANKPSCMPSMVGLLLLFGIIIKNAVLLIDFYKEFKTKSPFEAAKESVKLRFRPVLMTAFGTIAGMIPIALEKAVGLERLSPIADVAIGGLLVGSILTLVYIPMLAYSTDKLTNR
ncbi:MAG: efflux RND transporter permease subunit, partial [Nautiliaceae bacterium]